MVKEEYKNYLSTLSKNKVSKLRKERDNELSEIHNRIKKLLIEEEKAVHKIEGTKRKAQVISEIQSIAEEQRRKCCL